MTDRCEPSEEMRGADGWHWISAYSGPLFWDSEYQGWNTDEGDHTSPDECPINWRYIAPVAVNMLSGFDDAAPLDTKPPDPA